MTMQAVANWFRRQRERYELDRLGNAELARVAHDIGISPGDLDRLVAAAHDPEQLSAMLKALGIDEDALAIGPGAAARHATDLRIVSDLRGMRV